MGYTSSILSDDTSETDYGFEERGRGRIRRMPNGTWSEGERVRLRISGGGYLVIAVSHFGLEDHDDKTYGRRSSVVGTNWPWSLRSN